MTVRRRVAIAAWLIGALGVLVGASAQVSAADAPQGVWIRGAGATFPAPLYEKWIAAYQAQNPAVSVTYDAVGSGEGISRFKTGSVDFAGSDVPPSDKEVAGVARGVTLVPGTAGMIVLAYNLPGLEATLRLPRNVYTDIFAGRLTRWDDPKIRAANPGVTLPKLDIAVVARVDSSGTTAAFTSHLAAAYPAWREEGLAVGKLIEWPRQVMLARGNEGVASRVKISIGAIGYMEYGFASRLGLPVAALQNKAGEYVLPTEAAGQQGLAEASAADASAMPVAVVDPAAAGAYPIVTYSWLLLYRNYPDAAKGAAVREFVRWGLSDSGQKFAAEMGYLPLPATVAQLGQQALVAAGQ